MPRRRAISERITETREKLRDLQDRKRLQDLQEKLRKRPKRKTGR